MPWNCHDIGAVIILSLSDGGKVHYIDIKFNDGECGIDTQYNVSNEDIPGSAAIEKVVCSATSSISATASA